jgi:DNA-directed RNA polymerase subunit RPC12/RpoP
MATKPLSETHPALAAEWHPTLNKDVTPNELIAGSGKKVWWLGNCGHTFDSVVFERAKRGAGCPYCSGHRVLKGFNDLSFSYSHLASEWHPTKNGDLLPDSVGAFSGKKVWWLGKCGHEWESKIASRTLGGGCPYCSSSNPKTLSGFNDLATTNPQIASEWHPTKNGELKPTHLSLGSNKKVWWLGKCGHEWAQRVNDRKNGASCPFCRGKAVLAGFNDLATTHPALAAEWHPTKNGDITPKDKSAGNKFSVFWLGKCGHEWKATINNRTDGSSCPTCSPGGFNSSRSGVLYFIHNRNLHSFKVGISSKETKNNRLSNFESFGWEVLRIWENDSGRVILNTETKFLSWLRKTRGIPQFLDKQTIGLIRGETETFSDSIISKQEVITKIEEFIAQEI